MWGHAGTPHHPQPRRGCRPYHAYWGAQNANYQNLQPLRGWVYLCDCRYPHVADCASLIVNMGLLRLQPLCGWVLCVYNSRPLRTLYRGGDIVSVGYAIAHPRLNPVGILPPGSRPSDVHSDNSIIAVVLEALLRLWMR